MVLRVRRRRLEGQIGGRTFLLFFFFFGPRSKAEVALRGPLSRVRVIRVFDGEGNGQKGGRVAIKEVNRTAHSEKRWK